MISTEESKKDIDKNKFGELVKTHLLAHCFDNFLNLDDSNLQMFFSVNSNSGTSFMSVSSHCFGHLQITVSHGDTNYTKILQPAFFVNVEISQNPCQKKHVRNIFGHIFHDVFLVFNHVSGQISIIPKPELRGFWGGFPY